MPGGLAQATDHAPRQLLAVQDGDAGGLHPQALDRELVHRRVEHEEVERVAILREGRRAVEQSGGQARDGVVDRLRVGPDPVAQAFQPRDLLGLERAVLVRPDVEEQVAAHADRLREHPHDLPHRLVVVILHVW